MLQLYDMTRAKEDHTERLAKADSIKADIAKTLDAVFDANNVLQVRSRSIIFSFHKKIFKVILTSKACLFVDQHLAKNLARITLNIKTFPYDTIYIWHLYNPTSIERFSLMTTQRFS